MQTIQAPTTEGVFGPEVLLNAETGEGCLRANDGVVTGPLPSAPATNAFLVWVGFAVLVVSEGVRDEHLTLVAMKLRQRLHADRLPVVFSRGKSGTAAGVSIAIEAVGAPIAELARAEAYALVQLAWEEDLVTVQVGEEAFTFEVSFAETEAGSYAPQVRPR